MTARNTTTLSNPAIELRRLAIVADRAGRHVTVVAWAPKVRITLLTLATFAALC